MGDFQEYWGEIFSDKYNHKKEVKWIEDEITDIKNLEEPK